MPKAAVAREVVVLKSIANVFKREFHAIQIASASTARTSKVAKKGKTFLSIKQN